MEAFKTKYGIQVTNNNHENVFLEVARRDLKAFLAVHSGLYRSVGALTDGTHVLCVEFSEFKARSFTSSESWAIRMRGLLHIFQAMQPDSTAMRAGVVSLCNMQGWSLYENFSLDAQRRFSEFLSQTYPLRIQQVAILHSNALVVLLYNTFKFAISKKVRERYVFRQDFVGFLKTSRYSRNVLPREWGGFLDSSDDILLSTVLEKLRERYALEAKFQL